MSRIGKQPIPIPDKVSVDLQGHHLKVFGPKGDLERHLHPEININVASNEIVITRPSDAKRHRALHGLTRALVANMLEGCKNGYSKSLEVYGVGYGVQLQGQKLSVNCGRSHPVVFDVPAAVTVEVTTPQARGDTDPARFSVHGADKQAVGEFAARVRKARPPEPYKGKGLRYEGEYVRRKEGKAFAGLG